MISIIISNLNIHKTLLDIGAGANLSPFTLSERLGLGELKLTIVVFQLADHYYDPLRDC